MIRCGKCQTDNRAERRFCWQCGAGLEPADCGACGFGNYPHEQFCGGCGVGLGEATTAWDAAERRQMTVMFCDLVGSTALSRRLDAEDLRDLITAFQDLCRARIESHGGFIARYMGDGLLVYFGYPVAHEDDTHRAVRAALDVLAGVDALEGFAATPQVRIGLATGQVIVGDIIGEGASEEAAVVGETPNLAARLQGLAEPGTAVLSDRTRRLTADRFDAHDLGTHSLKGFAEPVQAWRVTGRRHPGALWEGDGPLVGRVHELDLLTDLWRAAAAGRGRTVDLQAEAGLGKTRLMAALYEGVAADVGTFQVLRCDALGERTALHPVRDAVADACGLAPGDDIDQRRHKLSDWLRSWEGEAWSAPFSVLLALGDESLDGGPEQQRDTLHEAVFAWLEASPGPLLLVVEDVHLADPSTRIWVDALAHRSRAHPWMVVISRRAGEPTDGAMRMSLDRLDADESRQLVDSVSGGLDPALVDAVVSRGDGVPAYLEALTRVMASGDRDAVPDTLHDSLMARLDGLGVGRDVARAAAVLGRRFSLSLLEAVYRGKGLREGLAQLEQHNIVHRTRNGYAFQHALLRDVAYNSVLKKTLRQGHEKVAQALIQQPGADPATIAEHFGRAGNAHQAAIWWRNAADRAIAAAATEEAIAALQRGIDILPEPDAASAPVVIDLRVALAMRLRLRSKLHTAQEGAFEVLRPALELARRFGLLEHESHVQFALGTLYFNTHEAQACREAQTEALRLARASGSVLAEVRALGGLADAHVAEAGYPAAKALLAECVDRAADAGLIAIAAAHAPLQVFTELFLDELDSAHEASKRSLDLAAQPGALPRGIAMTHMSRGVVDSERGQLDEALLHIEKADALSRQVGVGVWCMSVLGWSRVLRVLGDDERRDRVLAEFESVLSPPHPLLAIAWASRVGLAFPDERRPLLDRLLAYNDTNVRVNMRVWIAVETATSLIEARDLQALDHAIPRLRSRITTAQAPFCTRYLDASEALADVLRDPDSEAARRRLAAVEASARSNGAKGLLAVLGRVPVDA